MKQILAQQLITAEMTIFPPPKVAALQIEEGLLRQETTNEFYMPLSSTIVLKRKKEMLYVPLDFEIDKAI